MLNVRSSADIDRTIQAGIPEGPSIDYKQSVDIGPRDARLETLKDLTGMGNGGSGTVLFGVAKNPQDRELPSHVSPLTDPGLQGRLEDIVRAGVSPPLLSTYHRIAYQGGYVLAVEITRSPLGPYMVQGYGDWRYYIRIGSRTEPMSEQQIRDAYMLAARAREQREDVWKAHLLPLKPQRAIPCLSVSALPEEPLQELIDLGTIHPDEFWSPAALGAYHNQSFAPRDLKIWGHGLFGEEIWPDGHTIRFRLYRDGAIGLAMDFPEESRDIRPKSLARVLHAQLIYMGWLWGKVRIRTPVELRFNLHHIEAAQLSEPSAVIGRHVSEPQRPADVLPPLEIAVTEEVLAGDLSRARIRHLMVRRFVDRVFQAFGRPRASEETFTTGWLYGSDGQPLRMSVVGAGLCRGTRGDSLGRIYADGYVERNATQIGHLVNGVILDREGNAMAAVEMAVGSGLPDDFVVQAFTDEALYSCLGPEPLPSPQTRIAPTPTGQWSGQRLTDFIV